MLGVHAGLVQLTVKTVVPVIVMGDTGLEIWFQIRAMPSHVCVVMAVEGKEETLQEVLLVASLGVRPVTFHKSVMALPFLTRLIAVRLPVKAGVTVSVFTKGVPVMLQAEPSHWRVPPLFVHVQVVPTTVALAGSTL